MICLIEMVIDGEETTYTPSCQCGWCGNVAATVEWAELDNRHHYTKVHAQAGAA